MDAKGIEVFEGIVVTKRLAKVAAQGERQKRGSFGFMSFGATFEYYLENLQLEAVPDEGTRCFFIARLLPVAMEVNGFSAVYYKPEFVACINRQPKLTDNGWEWPGSPHGKAA